MMRAPPKAADWLSWPNGVLRLGVLLVVGLAVAAGLRHYPGEIRSLGNTARANAALSYADREAGGGNSVMPEQRALYEFRGRIPIGDPYRVVVGARQDGWTDLTEGSAEPFLRYWLMPRRSAADARWLVCVGCDPEDFPGAAEVWSGEGGVRLLRLPE
jgi:hypothetical protein